MEQTRLKIGFVALCDSAPLVVAKERGFFVEQGLVVELSREPSWANIRDKLAVGLLDAAQMLAPMPLSATLGLGNVRAPVITALGLNMGGNAITLSHGLLERMEGTSAAALKAVIDQDRAAGRPPLTLAMVYPFSPHNYELRLWLAGGGIDPDRDVRLVVVPPPQMVAWLAAGHIAGFCVGEPWNTVAAKLDLGRVVVTGRDIQDSRIEKVLGVREDWAEQHPQTHRALLRAVLLACRWVEGNRAETAEIIAQPATLNAPLEVVRSCLEPSAGLSFLTNFPGQSQAAWYLDQMRRWGQLPADTDAAAVARQVYRGDLFRLAAQDLELECPAED
ncbi:MAG TPA: CmpA/NrtA family ABC transporter substrate-binding protein [Patescibacteria group bacterium]|nr:CmpA/NrtA family ABC transporter substrate-binding protein [Patescibacteria group bacterium]